MLPAEALHPQAYPGRAAVLMSVLMSVTNVVDMVNPSAFLADSAFLAVSAISLVKGAKFLNPQKVFNFCFLKRWGLKTLLENWGLGEMGGERWHN